MFSFPTSLGIRNAVTMVNIPDSCNICCVVSIRVVFKHSKGTAGRPYSISHNKDKNMVDPKRVLSYEDMLEAIQEPKKVIIDVREPHEVASTGKIPSSINIPLQSVHGALESMSEEDFRRQFKREKPTTEDELVFYCQSGRRSTEALDKALKLGYKNSKNYLGSWSEWSNKRK